MYIGFACPLVRYPIILPSKVITKRCNGWILTRLTIYTINTLFCNFMKERVLTLIMCVCLGAGALWAQVIGASVLVKGASQGTVTDVDGKFALDNVPASAKMLVVSFVGMKTREVPVSDRVEIVLENDQQVLDEVLVTVAYGTAKRSSLTGAISSVDQKQIELRPASSVTSALEGSTSGVQINSTYGAPGSSPEIRIRGIGTVNGSSSPLYVVDGVPFSGSIADINPADIESMSVLKDAA